MIFNLNMQQNTISFNKTGYFSSLICDYLEQNSDLKPFYNRFPSIENFKSQIEEKHNAFKRETRELLSNILLNQNKGVEVSGLTAQNIESLKSENTFTITTGHQLNLFTGPFYFLYKIISTINLTEQLKKTHPEYNFVPIYWMATEDHDFDEINFFNFKEKKIQWNKDASGGVGRLLTKELESVFKVYSSELGSSRNAEYLKILFKEAYLKHETLAEATRFLVNELFKDYGLVIIDADNADLKKQFIPFIEEELLNQTSFKSVSKTNKQINELPEDYKIQVNPREINLFYLTDNSRERIVLEDEVYKVLNTNVSWSKNEVLKEVSEHPERFSPNVIMRPLYQEVILPNLCYIGGGGELAYWFQLKTYFNKVEVPFPMLLLRNSVLLQKESQHRKLEKLNVSSEDLFLKRDLLINKKVREISNLDIDFSTQKKYLQEQFKDLYKIAEQTDKSFLGAVKAQEIKQLKGLESLEKRLLKAQKRKLADYVSRMTDLQNELFPNQSLQERQSNFSEFYLEHGELLIKKLSESLQPLKSEFSIITL